MRHGFIYNAMTLAEIEHPIAQELSTIVQATELGLSESDHVPKTIKIDHVQPFDSQLGDHIITVYDRDTNNMSIVRVPVFTDLDSGLTIQSHDGELELTSARILVSDLNGITFKVRDDREGMPFSVPLIQFDVAEWGILFHAKNLKGDRVKNHSGVYESEQYDVWSGNLRSLASIPKLYALAIMHLADL